MAGICVQDVGRTRQDISYLICQKRVMVREMRMSFFSIVKGGGQVRRVADQNCGTPGPTNAARYAVSIISDPLLRRIFRSRFIGVGCRYCSAEVAIIDPQRSVPTGPRGLPR
jgi:hypothetical protein